MELARRVHQTWITFATTGDPGWSPYNAQQRSVMLINTTWETLTSIGCPNALARTASLELCRAISQIATAKKRNDAHIQATPSS